MADVVHFFHGDDRILMILLLDRWHSLWMEIDARFKLTFWQVTCSWNLNRPWSWCVIIMNSMIDDSVRGDTKWPKRKTLRPWLLFSLFYIGLLTFDAFLWWYLREGKSTHSLRTRQWQFYIKSFTSEVIQPWLLPVQNRTVTFCLRHILSFTWLIFLMVRK